MDLPNRDRERPIQYASVPMQPESSNKDDSMAEVTARGATLQQYSTLIRLYVEETGTELGPASDTTCEIRGYILANGEKRDVYVDLPQKHDFSNENGGLGRIVCEMAKVSRVLPANFTGVLLEQGRPTFGDRYFTNASVDWNTADVKWMNGNPWWFTQTVINDQNFRGHLWWQVTTL
jgi:hypothetical protein